MDKELLLSYGIDFAKGLSNCMDNLPFYKKILAMFLADDCFTRARSAHADRDYKTLFSCMHELKGVSGNAALVTLYDASASLSELLRHGTDLDAEVDRLFAEADAAYQRACQGIDLIIAQA